MDAVDFPPALQERARLQKKEMAVNWCTSCKCVLANEEVVNGVCERCGSEVVHKVKSQWMLKITAYAQRLIDDLDLVDYPERVKAQQKNWIGRPEGAEVDFQTTAGDALTVYTTRPDTLYGATYMVVSPGTRSSRSGRTSSPIWRRSVRIRPRPRKNPISSAPRSRRIRPACGSKA